MQSKEFGNVVALIVDMQVGVFATPRHDRAGTAERINALTAAVRGHGGRVVFIRHTDAADGLAEGSPAWQLLPELVCSAADRYVEKSACASDFCVDTTVRTAAGLGYPVRIASDAHTTADRPHLDAETIIRHHNYVWENLIVPGNPVRLASSAQLCALLGAHCSAAR